MAAPTLAQYDKLFAQNITLSNQFKELIQVYKTKNASINATVNSMISKINALITNMGSSIFRPTELFFDRSILYTKNELQITNDIKDRSRSNWVKVTTSHDALDYPIPGSLTIVHPLRVRFSNPGYYESPQYSKDYSSTRMNFIVANYTATSDQINCEIDNLNLTLINRGAWNVGHRAFTCNTIHISGLDSYKTLYVRFSNEGGYGGNSSKGQEIVSYGGNSNFQLDRVCNYPEIKY